MRIGVDIDEVLCPFTEPYMEFFNKRHGTRLTKEDFVHYNFDEITGVPLAECVRTCEAWSKAGHTSEMTPYPDALPALRKLKARGHELFVVSGRHAFSHAATREWLERHFPGIFTGVSFISFRSHDGDTTSKADRCRELGVRVLIEDDPHYIDECRAAGIPIILLAQPWNRAIKADAAVRLAKDWDDILREIESLEEKDI